MRKIAILTIDGKQASRVRIKGNARLVSVVGKVSESFRNDYPGHAAMTSVYAKVKNPSQYDSEFIFQEWENVLHVLYGALKEIPRLSPNAPHVTLEVKGEMKCQIFP